MNTQWVVRGRGDPLGAVRGFLQAVWSQAGLETLLLPMRTASGGQVSSQWLTDPAALSDADPFAPLLLRNGAAEVARRLRTQPGRRSGAVLHPCELRALTEVAKRHAFDLSSVLLIGIDCLATYSPDEYERRSGAPGGADRVTRETLRFARQGGILLYRNRPACQMCVSPVPVGADVCIGVLGLPVSEVILITARDGPTAERLGLEAITDGPAPAGLVADHEHMALALASRRDRARRRMTRYLSGVPATVDELITHLRNCAPCRECLDACPIYGAETVAYGVSPLDSGPEGMRRWLASCAGCGMCEQACPKHLPLAALLARLQSELTEAEGHAVGRSTRASLPSWT